MRTLSCMTALSLLACGVQAFTRPWPTPVRTNARERTRNYDVASDGIATALRATKAEAPLRARGDGATTAPILLQNASARVANTTGMPALAWIDEDSADSAATDNEEDADQSYRNGLATIGFITLLFASNSPVLHAAFSGTSATPPVLFLNSAVTAVGLAGVVVAAPLLGNVVSDPSQRSAAPADGGGPSAPLSRASLLAGAELGLWKTCGTTVNIYGLAQTSADHGAFLIQLTTLLVPVAQSLLGVPIPARIWTAIGLALGGVALFTQDPAQADCASLTGDALCALAAVFYAAYDLRLFKWGKLVPTDALITTKMVTQSLLSFAMLAALGREETLQFLAQASSQDVELVGAAALWSGAAVNCVAPYLQVSGQQAVGPARAQILYASQPLWAAVLSFFLLGERCGAAGGVGGAAFLGAMFLAATAEAPDPNCPAEECEV